MVKVRCTRNENGIVSVVAEYADFLCTPGLRLILDEKNGEKWIKYPTVVLELIAAAT